MTQVIARHPGHRPSPRPDAPQRRIGVHASAVQSPDCAASTTCPRPSSDRVAIPHHPAQPHDPIGAPNRRAQPFGAIVRPNRQAQPSGAITQPNRRAQPSGPTAPPQPSGPTAANDSPPLPPLPPCHDLQRITFARHQPHQIRSVCPEAVAGGTAPIRSIPQPNPWQTGLPPMRSSTAMSPLPPSAPSPRVAPFAPSPAGP